MYAANLNRHPHSRKQIHYFVFVIFKLFDRWGMIPKGCPVPTVTSQAASFCQNSPKFLGCGEFWNPKKDQLHFCPLLKKSLEDCPQACKGFCNLFIGGGGGKLHPMRLAKRLVSVPSERAFHSSLPAMLPHRGHPQG